MLQTALRFLSFPFIPENVWQRGLSFGRMSVGSVSEAGGRFLECEANRWPEGGTDRDAVEGKRRDSTTQTP